MTSPLSGPGLLLARSRISPTQSTLLSESTFLHWYDAEHIPEVVATSGVSSGFRYVDARKTSAMGDAVNEKPFLAIYPLEDAAFTTTEEFRRISVKSELLPGSGLVYDLAEFDISVLGYLGRKGREGRGKAEYMVTCGVRPSQELQKEDLNGFFEEQDEIVAKTKGYVRTLEFELKFARTNAQSRALKGLPAEEGAMPEPPKWFAVHEFEEEPEENLKRELEGMVERVIKENGWQGTHEVHLWKHARTHGDGKFFD